MNNGERLAVELDFWDDSVGSFEPAKVLRHLRKAFPNAEIDPTDHQQVRLLQELGFWSQGERDQKLREKLIRQSWGLYQTNGPTYRFVIPFPSGHRVSGCSRRLSVVFSIPLGLPAECRQQLKSFLLSLPMGKPKLGGLPISEEKSAMAVVISLPLFGPPGRELDEGTDVNGRRLRDLAEQLGERLEKAAVTLDRLRADGWSAKVALYDILLARQGIETREQAERHLRSLTLDPDEFILIEELDEDEMSV